MRGELVKPVAGRESWQAVKPTQTILTFTLY